MKRELAQPVVLGSMRLAPTTELAGLADLAATSDDDTRLALLCEIARTIEAEDRVREHIRSLRAPSPAVPPLPQRAIRPERRSA